MGSIKARPSLKKVDERHKMADFDKARHEKEENLPEEKRHANPEWLKKFWENQLKNV